MDLLGFSLTFFFFVALLYYKGSTLIEALSFPFSMKWIFLLFLIGAFISTFFGPKLERSPPIGEDVRYMIQHAYWIIMAAFFIIFARYLNMLELSKYIFYGLIASFILFYAPFVLEFKSGLFGINTKPNRNGVIYTNLALIPFSFYYAYTKWGKRTSVFLLIFFNACVMFTEGRSGTIVFLIETLLITQILFPISKVLFKVLLVVFGLFSLVASNPLVEPLLSGFANVVEPANPRLANLIRGEKDGDLTEDRSWLFRLMMIEKAKEIIVQYPMFGIGIHHFSFFDGTLRMSYTERRFAGKTKIALNTGSPHNSYYMILSENGIWGMFCVAILTFIPIFGFLFKILINDKLYFSDLTCVGLLGISIHWYSIASFMGGVTWLCIAFAIISRKIKF